LNEGKIGADISLSNYDVNLFSSKILIRISDMHTVFSVIKVLQKTWKGTPSFEYQYIDKQFHILDRINDVEFSEILT
jgi:hypothetical protein